MKNLKIQTTLNIYAEIDKSVQQQEGLKLEGKIII